MWGYRFHPSFPESDEYLIEATGPKELDEGIHSGYTEAKDGLEMGSIDIQRKGMAKDLLFYLYVNRNAYI